MNRLLPPEAGRQYELSYLAVIDKTTDEAVAVTQYCFEAFMHLNSMTFNDEKYNFIEINEAEFKNYKTMKVVPYKGIFTFLRRKTPQDRWEQENGVLDSI